MWIKKETKRISVPIVNSFTVNNLKYLLFKELTKANKNPTEIPTQTARTSLKAINIKRIIVINFKIGLASLFKLM